MNDQDDYDVTAMAIFAILFALPEGISKSALKGKLNIPGKAFADGLDSLRKLLQCSTPLQLIEAGDNLSLVTKPEYAEFISIFKKSPKTRLTNAALEVLAIIAYKQPVMRKDVEQIRGVDCESAISSLIDHGLVRVIGNLSRPGSPTLLQTTQKFLTSFNIRSLAELPSLRDDLY